MTYSEILAGVVGLWLSVQGLDKIWRRSPDESFLWKAAWSLLVLVPFVGPIIFFGMGTMPDKKGPEKHTLSRTTDTLSGFLGGAASTAEDPQLYGLIDDAHTEADFGELAAMYQSRANSGQAEAQARLAAFYDCGRGVAQDSTEAVRWYKAAADQGHAQAQTRLAAMLFEGTGVSRDAAAAAAWLELAARSGFAPAQSEYASALYDGRGVEKDDDAAMFWICRARLMGCNNHPRVFSELDSVMPAERVNALAEMAAHWQPGERPSL